MLLSAGVDVNPKWELGRLAKPPIAYAMAWNLTAVRKICDADAHLNRPGVRPFLEAGHLHDHLLEYLLHKIDQDPETLLSMAKLLLEKGVDIKGNNRALLHAVEMSGEGDIVELLLRHGADANVVSGKTSKKCALHLAIRARNAKMVQLLMEYGADPHKIICSNLVTPGPSKLKKPGSATPDHFGEYYSPIDLVKKCIPIDDRAEFFRLLNSKPARIRNPLLT
jgi:hypothetical protein